MLEHAQSLPKYIPRPTRVLVEDVLRIAAKFYGLSKESLIAHTRVRTFEQPRLVTMYVAKRLSERSNVVVAKHFGDRDHTTVRHAAFKVAWLIGERSEVPPRINCRLSHDMPINSMLKEEVLDLIDFIETALVPQIKTRPG